MKYMARYLIFILVILLLGCSRSSSCFLCESSNLKIEKIGEHIYKHVSFINYKGNSVGCNGVFSIFGENTVILDSPTDDLATLELLDYIEVNFHPNRIVAISNHFHVDCTRSFKAMLDRGKVIYTYDESIKLMENQALVANLLLIDHHLDMQFNNGEGLVHNRYFGPACTRVNIASYILLDSI